MTFTSVLDIQKGGKHYKGLAIQPIEIANKNKLCFRVFSALKYMFRHDKPGGEQKLDIKKAIHYLQILLEQEYEVLTKIEYSDEIYDNDHDDEHIHRNSK